MKCFKCQIKEVGEIVIICMSVLLVIKMNLSRTFLVTAETLDEFSVYEDLMFEDLMIIARGIVLVTLLHSCKKC